MNPVSTIIPNPTSWWKTYQTHRKQLEQDEEE